MPEIVYTTRLLSIRYLPEGWVELRFLKDDYEITIEDIVELKAILIEIKEKLGHSFPTLVISGKFGTIKKEAREFVSFSENTSPPISALAIVIHSLSQRILSNAIVRIKKNHYPVNIFKSEEKARHWLSRFIVKT